MSGGVTQRDIAEEQKSMQPRNPQLPAEVEVEVLRPFTDHKRQVVKKGERHKLPRIFALEMRAANKVKFVDPAPTQSAPVAPKGDDKKEMKK